MSTTESAEKIPKPQNTKERPSKRTYDQPQGDPNECATIRTPIGAPVVNTIAGPITEFEAVEENIPQHPAILAAGKRRTGKSTSIDNLMEKTMRHIPFGIVMSETLMNGFWQQRVPPRFCFQGWREDILTQLINRQKKMIQKYGKEDPRTFAFIILDDVIADQKKIRWSKNINSFFVEGRHINITVIVTTQYMRGIGPMVRGNMDIVFLQPIYSINDREVIRDLYAGWMRKVDFFHMMDEVVATEELEGSTASEPRLKVRVMVVQDWRQTCDATQKFKWWSPVHSNDVPPYRLCHPKYWKDRFENAKAAESIFENRAHQLQRKLLTPEERAEISFGGGLWAGRARAALIPGDDQAIQANQFI